MSEEDRTEERLIGAELKEVRKLAGFSQAELAQRLGMVPNYVSRLESGAASTSYANVRQWYRECGYELTPTVTQEGTRLGASDLARAVKALPKGQEEPVTLIARAWPYLPDILRGRILGMVEAYEALEIPADLLDALWKYKQRS